MINITGNGLEILAAILFSLTVLMPADFSKNCKRPGWFQSDLLQCEKSYNILYADWLHIVCVHAYVIPPDSLLQIIVIMLRVIVLVAVKLYGIPEIPVPFLNRIMEQNQSLIVIGKLIIILHPLKDRYIKLFMILS